MNKICLYGASGHGKVVKETVESCRLDLIAFLDDNPKVDFIDSIPVVHSKNIKAYEQYKLIISIGDNLIRKVLAEKMEVKFGTAIHPKSLVSKNSEIETGTVVMAGAIIHTDTRVGKHVIINTSTVLEHDCLIEDYVHISPNATVTGNVSIGEGTHIGTAATIVPNIKIGKWVTVGAGAVILKDVPDYAVVVGNPGKIIKFKK